MVLYQIVILCDHGVLHMLDLFIRLLILGYICQPPYAPCESTSHYFFMLLS